ncbi:hypothetical protein [Saccharopolyspora gregorii]|uniref:DUF222 domain-containing protein n=1 Tax=Saccharopolyspora gregorii TaxID=33914 RepID=A0ABP6RIN9_9PSEU
MTDVVLSSARPDYRFLFSCTVRWLPCGSASGLPHTKPGALAAGAILDEVTRMAAEVRPEDASRAQYQLMGSLGAPRVDRTGRVQAWADQVVLRLADADADRLKRWPRCARTKRSGVRAQLRAQRPLLLGWRNP